MYIEVIIDLKINKIKNYLIKKIINKNNYI